MTPPPDIFFHTEIKNLNLRIYIYYNINMTESQTSLKDFKDGLMAKHNLTYEEFNANYKYGGGDFGSHWTYYQKHMKFKLPNNELECVCGHKIQHNCFMYNEVEDKCIIVGSFCIKRFAYNKGRTCEVCGKSHRNSKYNRCNECKVKVCVKCKVPISKEVILRYPTSKYLRCKKCLREYYN